MGKYSLDEVLKRWEHGTLTAEQTIGQVLLLVQELSSRVGRLEKTAAAERLPISPGIDAYSLLSSAGVSSLVANW